MEDELYHKLLVQRFTDRTATDEELEVFIKLANEGKLDAYLMEAMNNDTGITPDDENDFPSPIKVRPLWHRIAAAASILLFVSVGAYFIIHRTPPEREWIAQNFKNDIGPGGNSATLTLGDGKVVALNARTKGQVAVQGNLAVMKTAEGQLEYRSIASGDNEISENTLATQRKEQYKVVLADGTNVWLNDASSIRYPTAFKGKYRDVTITGEVYFEVAHNASQPFRVKSAGQMIEVLGTHFNVNTYSDEPAVKTTLLEGKVKVSSAIDYKIIQPGKQALLKNARLSLTNADLEEAVAWKNGYFRFNNEKIEGVMRKLARWYDIDVRFDGPISQEEFNGTISRFTNISEVLESLQYSRSIHFKIEGRRVTILR